MVVIHLSPGGKKNQRIFRVTVAQKGAKLTGRYLEKIGQYDEELKSFQIKKDRFDHWVKLGAEPSQRVVKLMRDSEKGVLGKKVSKKAKLRVKKASRAEAAPAAEEAKA
jgi:small subunit ribosomal protein S16